MAGAVVLGPDGTASQSMRTERVFAGTGAAPDLMPILDMPLSVIAFCQSWFNVRQECARCKVVYLEHENFARRCSYHPLPRDASGTYVCCNTKPKLEGFGAYRGCQPCDHSTLNVWHCDLGRDDGACVLTAVPDTVKPLLGAAATFETVAHVRNFGDELLSLDDLFRVHVLEPHGISAAGGAFASDTCVRRRLRLHAHAGSIERLAALNDALRHEDEHLDYYTPVTRQFVSYTLVLRASGCIVAPEPPPNGTGK